MPSLEPMQSTVFLPSPVYREVPKIYYALPPPVIHPVPLPMVTIVPFAHAGNTPRCEEEIGSLNTDDRRAEEAFNRSESELQSLQLRYQDALRLAQNAEQAASSLASSAQATRGGWAGFFAVTSVASSFSAIKLRSDAQSLESQIANLQSQIGLARSRLNCFGTANEPLSAEVLKALKTLGIQCIQGGELHNLMSSVRPDDQAKSATKLQNLRLPPRMQDQACLTSLSLPPFPSVGLQILRTLRRPFIVQNNRISCSSVPLLLRTLDSCRTIGRSRIVRSWELSPWA